MQDSLNKKLQALRGGAVRPHIRKGSETINRRSRKICWPTGKVRYRDSHQAAQALEGTRRRRWSQEAASEETTRHELRSYRCEHCRGIHLTSQRVIAHGRPLAWGETTDGLTALPTGRTRHRRIRAINAVAMASAA